MGNLEKALFFFLGLIVTPWIGAGLGFLVFFVGLLVVSPFGTASSSNPGQFVVGLMSGAACLGLVVAGGLAAGLWRFIRRRDWARWLTYGALVGFALGWIAWWSSCTLLVASLSGL